MMTSPAGQDNAADVFVPGMVGAKIVAVTFGVVVTLAGFWWLAHPVRVLLTGEAAVAQVVAVIRQYPGQEPEAITSRKEIRKLEDQTRTAVFKYRLRFEENDGARREALLNYGQVVRPMYSIGDEVRITYVPGRPDDLIHTWNIRTWAFGIFFTLIGLIIVWSQSVILAHARKPILIDGLTDIDSKAV